MATTIVSAGDGTHTVTGLSTSESSDALLASKAGFLIGAIHVVDGGGTGFNGGTATVQASLDGTNWFTAKSVAGTEMTFTADGYFEFSLAAKYLRVTNDGSVSDVDVLIVLN